MSRALPSFAATLEPWWQARSERERTLLAALAAVALLVAVVTVVVRPLAAARADAVRSIRADTALDARLRAGLAAPAAAPARGDVAVTLAASVARAGLSARPVAISDAAARVSVAGVAYDALIRLIDDATRAGLRVTRLRVTPAAGAGMVDAELVLAR